MGCSQAVSEADALHMRAIFELARRGELASARERAPGEWREVVERLASGPDPHGALARAGQLPDACLAAPFPLALTRMLHQGSYPARMLTLDPAALAVLADPGRPDRGDLADELRVLADELGLEEAIARIRNREYLHLTHRELDGAPLEEVGAALSELVGACVQVALERIDPELREQVVVFGMGKLGGDELNFVSDIDLVFVHADEVVPDDERAHRVKLRLFDHLRRLVVLLEGSGRWRPLFRVDLRLRPFGTRGPLSMSMSGTESYYERHGRDWERQVWLRARPVAGNLSIGEQLLRRLEPFVYRRSVGPEIFDEVAKLMRRARREASRGLGRAGVDLKHDAGGIREIEFFVQGLQLLNAGRKPGVRARGTLAGLDRLVAAGLLSDREHQELTEAYRWLRRVEHRVQLVEGQQTHDVPVSASDQTMLAHRLEPDQAPQQAVTRFRAALRTHRDAVMAIAQTLRAPEEAELLESERQRMWARDVVVDPGAPARVRIEALSTLGLRDPQEGNAMLQHLRTRREGAFADSGRAAQGADRLLLACLESADPDAALRRLVEFAAPRPAHFAAWRFLAEPAQASVVRLVAELLGSSEPLSRGLVGFRVERGVTGDDSLGLMLEAHATRLPDAETLEHDFERFCAARPPAEEAAGLDARLVRFKHRELVRIGLFDLGRRPDPLDVGHSLSNLADLILRAVLRDSARAYASGEIVDGPKHEFDLAVLALGKYGMQAMDYGSDLDLSFVFASDEADIPSVREHAIKVARRFIARLAERPHGVRLYEVDMRLRPSGRQGLLVSSLDGFRSYHARALPIWERLALLRLRPVAESPFGPGPAPSNGARPHRLADEIEDRVLPTALEPACPPDEVAAAVRSLKGRIELELARETRDVLNPKTGVGGCLEAELLVGALQLGHGPPRPSRGIPEALSELARAGALAAEEAAQLEAAYRFERRLLNRLRMMHGGEGGDDSDRLAVNSPRLTPLARRMGLTGADALLEAYRTQRAVIRRAFDRHLPSK